jgi:hypothetical protein
MAQPAQKKKKIGRNDPCPCGSGKKYKDCHQPIEQAFRSEQMQLREAQEILLPKIIEAAQEAPELFPVALELFWNGKYGPEQMSELDEHEDRGAERFLTWFAFDFRPDGGPTLVERLMTQHTAGDVELDEYEARLLTQWPATRLRPYIVTEVRKGKGISARDLLTEHSIDVADQTSARRMLVDEVMVAHLVPVDQAEPEGPAIYYLAGAAAQLTADTAEKLVEFCELHLADMRREQPEAGWEDFLAERSHLLNHFVMALPREYDPSMLDKILLEGRTTLQLTTESVGRLLGRDSDVSADDDDEDRDDAAAAGDQPDDQPATDRES